MSRKKLRRYFRHGLFPQLLVFEVVARLGSVTRAAEELHLAQPTVSIQLKKLAAALGVTLFEQRGRQLHLTAAGCVLRDTCGELTALLERADECLAPWRSPEPAPLFMREAVLLDALDPPANNSGPEGEEESSEWKSRATTTRR